MTDTRNMPSIDFAQFGPVDQVPLSKIQQLTGSYLTRNWTTIPHVFHFDDLDVTNVETTRKRPGEPNESPSTPSVIVKAVAITLTEHPKLNSSLDANGSGLIVKKYVNVGVA